MMTSDSLDVPETRRCAFCDYLSGARPFTILWRNDLIAILVTREQRGIAHVLVVPVEHRPTLLDLKSREATAVMTAVVEVARAIDASERRPGIAVWQNNGTPANQAIPHMHFHVAGTVDGGGTEWGEVAEISIEATNRIAAKLRPFLNVGAIASQG